MSATLVIDYDGPLAQITLTRPEVLNRFDPELHREFIAALLEVRGRTGVRALILASTGKVFSAGGSFDFMQACRADTGFRIAALDEGRLLFHTLTDLPIPVVTALHGDAIG